MDQDEHQTKNRNSIQFLGVRVVILIGVVFTLLQVQQSLLQGQLSLPITYDDTVYMSDALRRLFHLYNQGFSAFILEWFNRPPHSPTSTFTPLLGFAVFGRQDWAPAATNGIYLIGLLFLISYLTAHLSWLYQITIVMVLLCCPITGHLIIDSRPDILCGVAIAGASFLLLQKPEFKSKQTTCILAGILAGLAFLAKPSVSPITATILVITLIIAIASDYFQNYSQDKSEFKGLKNFHLVFRSFRPYVPFIIVTVLMSLPHYWFAFEQIRIYIYNTVFGPSKEIWQLKASLAEHLLYYINGAGGRAMFGFDRTTWGSIAILTGLLSLTIAILMSKGRQLWHALPYCLVIGVTYLLITIPKVKSPFLGMSFGGMVLLSTLLCLIYIAQSLKKCSGKPYRVLENAVCVAIIIASLWTFQWTWYNKAGQIRPGAPYQANYEHAVLTEIAQKIEPRLRQAQDQCEFVLAATIEAGYLNLGTLELELLKSGVANFSTLPAMIDLSYKEQFEKSLFQSDFIIAFSPDNPTRASWLASEQFLAQYLETLNTHKGFDLVKTLERPKSLGGGQVFLYENNQNTCKPK